MILRKKLKFFFILFLILSIFIYIIYLQNTKKIETKIKIPETENITDDQVYSSNIIKDVKYSTTDADGNQYIVTALTGEIDYAKPNILYLTNVKALVKMKNSNTVTIFSDYGKYNSENFDTIFSKNVIINYIDNKIIGEYLDFSMERNSMIISRNVVYTNLENILKADVIEMDIKTKDTKIFMYEKEKKVKIKSKD